MQTIKKSTGKLFSALETLIEKIILFFVKLTGREISEETKNSVHQFVGFCLVGVSNTIISYLIYAGTVLLLRALNLFPETDIFIGQIVSFTLSVLWSFYWNNRFVFRLKSGEKRNLFAALLKTYMAYAFTGLFLNSALLYLWVKILHISEFIAPILNLLISIPLNFLINKFWAFKSKPKEAEERKETTEPDKK